MAHGIGIGISPSILGGGMPASVRANQPSLDLDFLQQRYGMNRQPVAFSDIITFTRASAATRVNPLGLIETVAANVPCIDHSPVNLATGTGAQTLALTKDRTYAITAVGGTVVVTGAGVNVAQMGAASGVIQTPAGSGTVDVTFTPSGGPTALHVREVLGLGVWEQRTNFVQNSDCKSGTPFYFPVSGVTDAGIDSSVLAPDGSTGARKLIVTGALGTQIRLGDIINGISGTPYAGSVWLRAADGSQPTFSFQVNDVGLSNATLNSNWKRVSTVASTTNTYRFIDIELPVGTYHIWGAQIEAGAFATPYIPTAGAQVTRASDLSQINTLSPWHNAGGGTIYAEASVPQIPPGSSFPMVARFSGATGEAISIGFFTTISALEVASGSVNQAALYPATAALLRKAAGAYALNSFGLSVNGSAALTDSSGVLPAVSTMWLGSTGAGLFMNGHIRKIRYFKSRLPDAQLQALTA